MNFSEKQPFVFFLSRVSLFEKYSHILIFYYFSSVRSFVTNAANAQSLTWWASSSRVDFHIHYMTSRDRLVWLRHSLHVLFSLLQFTHTQTLSHTHTHTHSHIHPYTHSHTQSQSFSLFHSYSLFTQTHTHTHTHTLSLSLSLFSFIHFLSLSLSFPLSRGSHISYSVEFTVARVIQSSQPINWLRNQAKEVIVVFEIKLFDFKA